MEQTKNTNKLQSHNSPSWNLACSVCHMSLGGQIKGSAGRLQLFLTELPSLFPSSKHSPWPQGPAFHQLGHSISLPQNPNPSLFYMGVVRIRQNWGWKGILQTPWKYLYIGWVLLKYILRNLDQTDSATSPRKGSNIKVLPVYGEPSWQQSLKGRKKQKLEMCSKPEGNYGKWSDVPEGKLAENRGNHWWRILEFSNGYG